MAVKAKEHFQVVSDDSQNNEGGAQKALASATTEATGASQASFGTPLLAATRWHAILTNLNTG